MEYERKNGVEHDFKVFGLSNWMNSVSLTGKGAVLDMFYLRCLLVDVQTTLLRS